MIARPEAAVSPTQPTFTFRMIRAFVVSLATVCCVYKGGDSSLSGLEQRIHDLDHIFVDLRLVVQKRC